MGKMSTKQCDAANEKCTIFICIFSTTTAQKQIAYKYILSVKCFVSKLAGGHRVMARGAKGQI